MAGTIPTLKEQLTPGTRFTVSNGQHVEVLPDPKHPQEIGGQAHMCISSQYVPHARIPDTGVYLGYPCPHFSSPALSYNPGASSYGCRIVTELHGEYGPFKLRLTQDSGQRLADAWAQFQEKSKELTGACVGCTVFQYVE